MACMVIFDNYSRRIGLSAWQGRAALDCRRCPRRRWGRGPPRTEAAAKLSKKLGPGRRPAAAAAAYGEPRRARLLLWKHCLNMVHGLPRHACALVAWAAALVSLLGLLLL